MILRIVRFTAVVLAATGLLFVPTTEVLFSSGKQDASVYEVKAKDLQLTCNGSAVLAGGSTGTSVNSFKYVGAASVAASYSAAQNTTLSIFGHRNIVGFGGRQDINGVIAKPGTLRVIDSTGKTAQGSALLSANQLQMISQKRITGLLAAPCIRAQSEFWLVGGSTKVGREALLILNNPSPVDATVDLEVFTENGVSHSAGLTGIAVPSGETTVLPLAGFVLRASSIAVHVLSHGGSITAFIQQKAVRGIFANGADYISPSQVVAKTSFFPGLLVRGSDSAHQLRTAGAKYRDVENMLRVYVPGQEDANLTLQILGSDNKTFGTVLSITAAAGKVSDFDIKGLKDGDYLGVLSSNVEVRSAIRLVRARASGDKFADFTWINAAEDFSNLRYVAIPNKAISKLAIVNPSNKQIKVNLQIGSAKVARRIDATSQIIVSTTQGIAVGISPDNSEVLANLIIDLNGRVASVPVLDEKNISGQVKVSVH